MSNRAESKIYLRLISLFFIFLSLTGCASFMTEQAQTAQNQEISWQKREQTLSNITAWDLKALIAVRDQKDSWSATLQWAQQAKNYHIMLFGPLGTHSIELTGQPGKVELASSDGKKYTATSAEQLLAQQVGWQLPVSNLYYWIRGLPVPGQSSQTQFDNFHHLTQLSQQGWTIRYLRYTSVGNIDVPSKIFLDNSQLNVKIIINQWNFANI